jgi:hypothetical protein
MPPAAAGWQQWAGEPQPQIAIHRTVSRLFYFLSSFDETTTKLHLCAEKLTEAVLHLNLGHLWRFLVLCCFVWFGFFPLMRQWQNYFETPSPGLEAEGLTPKLLRLKLYCIWTLRFFFIYLFFSYYFFQSCLCLSNACSAYCWLVHYLSLFMSLKLFHLFACFVFSTCLFVFPFFFNFFTFHLLSPFHSKYHHCYYYKLENT